MNDESAGENMADIKVSFLFPPSSTKTARITIKKNTWYVSITKI